MEKRYVDAKELAVYLGMKIDTIYDLTCQRKLPGYKVGRLLRFDLREIEEMMAENRVEEIG